MTPQAKARDRFSPLWLLWVPLLLGAGLRLSYSFSQYPLYFPEADQEEGYYETGVGLLAYHSLGVGIPDPVPRAWRGPLYPSFIALVETPFRKPFPGHVRLAQAALASLGIVVVFALGRALVSPLAGFCAALGLALNSEHIQSAASLNIHGFYSFCILGAAVAAFWWAKKRDPKSAALLGFSLGATLLCRSAHFPLPVLLGGACLGWGRFRPDAWRQISAMAAATLLFILPMTARNALHFKAFIPLDGYAGAVLLLGSTQSSGTSFPVHQAMDLAERMEPGFKSRKLANNDLHRAFLRLALKEMKAHPLRYARFCMTRFFLFWREFWAALLLGACALFLNRGDRALQAVFLVAASFSGYALGGGTPEHQVAALPLLSLMAGCGIGSLAKRTRLAGKPSPRPWHWSFSAALAILAGLYLAVCGFLALEARAHWLRPELGQERFDSGRELEVLRLATVNSRGPTANVDYATALYWWADRWIRPEDQARAVEALRQAQLASAKALRFRTPSEPGDLTIVARMAYEQSRQGGALPRAEASLRIEGEYLKEALRRDPEDRAALKRMVQRHLDSGDARRGMYYANALARALGNAPDAERAEAFLARAQFELQLKDYARAGRDLKDNLRAAGSPPKAVVALSAVLYRQGRYQEALGLMNNNAASADDARPSSRAQLLATRSLVRMKLGDAQGAEQDMLSALKADPETACELSPALIDRAQVAPVYFDLCLAGRPGDPQLLLDRGVSRYLRGDGARAVLDFRRALAARPESLEAALSLATALHSAKKDSEAFSIIDRSLALERKGAANALLRDAVRFRESLRPSAGAPASSQDRRNR